jgi:hypothetical protein
MMRGIFNWPALEKYFIYCDAYLQDCTFFKEIKKEKAPGYWSFFLSVHRTSLSSNFLMRSLRAIRAF